MKKILIGRPLYRQKLKELDEKRLLNGKLDSKDQKLYRDCIYLINRINKQVIVLKMFPIIYIVIFLSAFLIPKLSSLNMYILIMCCWVLGRFLLIKSKQNNFTDFRFANKLWYIFVIFGTFVPLLILGISTSFIFLILYLTAIIYIAYYGRKVYVNGKKVNSGYN